MTSSNVSGELMLISEVMTVLSETNCFPKRISHISTESLAREGSVTEPMNGLSESVMCARSMSR